MDLNNERPAALLSKVDVRETARAGLNLVGAPAALLTPVSFMPALPWARTSSGGWPQA